jgi:hypothetical protein
MRSQVVYKSYKQRSLAFLALQNPVLYDERKPTQENYKLIIIMKKTWPYITWVIIHLIKLYRYLARTLYS